MVTKKTEVTINGKEVIGKSPARWTLRAGVRPVVEQFTLSPDDAKSLHDAFGPLTLEMRPPEGAPVVVQKLWALNVLPGPTPYHSNLVVADRRWFWPYKRVVKRFNMRRKVGFKRILANDQFVVNFDRAPDIAFWKFSKKNGNRRYVALSMLQEMLEAVGKAEKDLFNGEAFGAVIDARIGSNIQALPLENLEVDDQGDQAMERVLSYLPEAAITVDYDGRVIVYSRAGGDEELLVKAVMPEIRELGHTDLVLNRNLRPKEIRVLFTRKVEVLHDFIENTTAVGQTTTADRLGNKREMDNVLPIPDYQLTVDGNVLPQSTYITLDQAFNAWGDLPLLGTQKQLDHNIVQQAFIPHMDLWTALQLAGQRPDSQGTLANWTGRIAMVMEHYRQTFRLNPVWVDNSLHIEASRLATIDPQTGQRGPSRVYGDYAVMYTQRSLWRNIAENKPMDYVINKSAFPSSGQIDDTAEISPAVVEILHHDQGVIHIDYRIDPVRQYEMILPSQVVLASMPTADVTKRTRPITFDNVLTASNPPRLSSAFKMKVILTHTPAVPNDSRQLHEIVVKPEDINELVPQHVKSSLNDARGPAMEVRIGPQVEVARIAWNDEKSQEIERVFGITEGEPDLSGLVLNEGETGNLETGASLNSIAKAQAAAIYTSLVDRYEGTMGGAMNGNIHLNGWMDEIRHEAQPLGGAHTVLEMPHRIPQMSLFGWLDSNSRAMIMHLVSVER